MQKLVLLLLLNLQLPATFCQSVKKIDGSVIFHAQLDSTIAALMKKANISGAAIAIFNNNKPVYKKAFGLANVPDGIPLKTSSVLYAASFSKALFAYIVMQLVQENLIELDKPLVNYLNQPLPSYKIPGWNRGYQHIAEDKRYEKITARMCLSHTTGFPNWRWFEADKKLKIKFEPGSRYSYSGEGIYLLQFVIEQLTGKGLETLSRERVFVPFKMKQTSYTWQQDYAANLCLGHNDKGKPYDFFKWKEGSAGGSLCSTLDDYTNFFACLMQSKGLSKSSFKQMTSMQVRIKSKQQFGPNAQTIVSDNDAIELGYGLGVGVFKSPYGSAFFKEGHDEGWGHYSVIFPGRQTGIIIFTNNDNGESIFKELLATAIGDRFTPWYWENYIPFDYQP